MAKLVPVGAPARRHPAKVKGWLDAASANRGPSSSDVAGYLLDTNVLSELLKKRAEPVGTEDALIAAAAMANGLVVATRNAGHFSPVKTLRIINWWPERVHVRGIRPTSG